jgi:hypothetical protein
MKHMRRGVKRRGKKRRGRVGIKVIKALGKKGASLALKHRKTLGRAALHGGGAALSAYTGNPAPMAVAKMADSALFSKRNRSSVGASARPTGAKGF